MEQAAEEAIQVEEVVQFQVAEEKEENRSIVKIKPEVVKISVDNRILKSIEKEFKTCKEIAEEIDEIPRRVFIRIKSLQRCNKVYEIQGHSEGLGVKPLKYKAKQ